MADKTFYWNILDTVDDIIKKTKEEGFDIPKEMTLIRKICFSSIIKLGEKFAIDYEEEVPEKDNTGIMDTAKSLAGINKKPVLKDYVLIYRDGSVDLSKKMSSDELREIMHDDYDRIVLKKVKTLNNEQKDEKINVFDIDKADKEERERIEKEKIDIEKKKAKEEKERFEREAREKEESLEYHFYYGNRYPDDPDGKKTFRSFLFDHYICHVETVKDIKVIKGDFNIYIYPITVEETTMITKIFVVIDHNGIIRTGISKGESSAVTVEIEGYKFMCRGSFRDFVFHSSVNLLNTDGSSMTESVEHFGREEKTSSICVRKDTGNTIFYIFPATTEALGNSNKTGLAAAAVIMFSKDDYNIDILAPTQDGDFILETAGGQMRLQCYCEGNMFCYEFTR